MPEPNQSLELASADASFRRYFRLTTEKNSYVVMDAPPEKESIAPFMVAADALTKQGIHVPEVFAVDADRGFILLEDLGIESYLEALPHDPNQLYSQAIDSLIKIQCGIIDQPEHPLADYDANKLEQELDIFIEWYVQCHLQTTLDADRLEVWRKLKNYLLDVCLNQPQVWVHRDFHSRNLMACNTNSPGVIDFQDMVCGPITYDLASIFKDCYIEWPRTRQLTWLDEYRGKAEHFFPQLRATGDEFIRWYDLTGMQRHLKVLGVFSRLHYRDGKSHYLNDLPLVRRYLLEVLDLYPELKDFKKLFSALPHG